MNWLNYLPITVLAFVLEIVDASFGMGYGTILTPALLMLGLDALRVVPAVIASQLVGDFLAVFFHHQFKNVDMSVGSQDFKVGATLAGFSLVGSVAAVLFALRLSKFALNLYIGLLVAVVGIVVLVTYEKDRDFSWLRLLFLGSIASFNKGLSGGGYGPVVAGGQILTGTEAPRGHWNHLSGRRRHVHRGCTDVRFFCESHRLATSACVSNWRCTVDTSSRICCKEVGKQASEVDYPRINSPARTINDSQNCKGFVTLKPLV